MPWQSRPTRAQAGPVLTRVTGGTLAAGPAAVITTAALAGTARVQRMVPACFRHFLRFYLSLIFLQFLAAASARWTSPKTEGAGRARPMAPRREPAVARVSESESNRGESIPGPPESPESGGGGQTPGRLVAIVGCGVARAHLTPS